MAVCSGPWASGTRPLRVPYASVSYDPVAQVRLEKALEELKGLPTLRLEDVGQLASILARIRADVGTSARVRCKLFAFLCQT